MLTRIRNANSVYHEKVEIPGSKIKVAIADVLKREGYIKDYSFAEDNKQGILTVKLKYGAEREKVITGIKRISRPGLRQYSKKKEFLLAYSVSNTLPTTYRPSKPFNFGLPNPFLAGLNNLCNSAYKPFLRQPKPTSKQLRRLFASNFKRFLFFPNLGEVIKSVSRQESSITIWNIGANHE